MNARAVHLIVCALVAVAGLWGVHLQVEYSGWLVFVGLLAFLNRA